MVLTARARRKLLDQTLVERRAVLALTIRERAVFLVLAVLLVSVAALLALAGSTAATVPATFAAGIGGLLLRTHGGSPFHSGR